MKFIIDRQEQQAGKQDELFRHMKYKHGVLSESMPVKL
jgi:hypothetical protein